MLRKTTFALFALLILGFLAGHAQQEALFSHYRFNALTINPAFAGSSELAQLRFNHRSQWSQFPGAPKTSTISLQGRYDEKNGMGIVLFNDTQGPTSRQGGQLAYAFHVPLRDRKTYFSLGMAVKGFQYRFAREQVYFQDPTDAAIAEASENIWVADLAFGAYLYNENLFLGFSAPNLIQTDVNLGAGTGREVISKLYRHYFLVGGYRLNYTSVSIEPSIFVKKVQTAPYQIEGAVKFYMADGQLHVGGSYRTDWRMSLLFGFQVKNVQFTYSADFMTRPVQTATSVFGLSNEFSIGIDLGQDRGSLYYQERKK